MKSGQFIDLISDVLGLDRKSVSWMARVLREAGELTSGARGVNAPHMTHLDSARLCIAAMTGESPAKIVESFRFFRDLPFRAEFYKEDPQRPFLTLFELPNPHTFELALTKAIWCWESRDFMDPLAIGGFEIPMCFRLHEVSSNVVGTIGENAMVYAQHEVPLTPTKGLRITREVSGVELQILGEALALREGAE